MDNLGIVLAGYQRQFPAEVRVHTLGHTIHKYAVIHGTFTTYNFSLILEGEGFYSYEDCPPIPIKAPCVITQWPKAKMHYGPTGQGWWQELYLIYAPDAIPALTQRGFIQPNRHWWPIDNPGPFLHAVEQLRSIAERIEEPGMADRLDRAAETAILESLLPGPILLNKSDKAVLRIKTVFEKDFLQNHDVDALAADEGLSPSVFRRIWKKHVGMSPQRYLIELRMRAARRLLTESKLNISEIAYQTGYTDPLYFSRLFHKTTGVSASTYRNNYRPGER